MNNDLEKTNITQLDSTSCISLIYLIFFGSILAYSAYIWLLKIRPPTEVATHAYVNPFVAVFIGVSLGKETVTWLQILGLVIILLSVMLVNSKKSLSKN